jgi:hypothetical protein
VSPSWPAFAASGFVARARHAWKSPWPASAADAVRDPGHGAGHWRCADAALASRTVPRNGLPWTPVPPVLPLLMELDNRESSISWLCLTEALTSRAEKLISRRKLTPHNDSALHRHAASSAPRRGQRKYRMGVIWNAYQAETSKVLDDQPTEEQTKQGTEVRDRQPRLRTWPSGNCRTAPTRPGSL